MATARHAAQDSGEGGDKVGWRFYWFGRAIAGRIIIIGQEHQKPRHGPIAQRATFQRHPEWSRHGDAPEARAGLFNRDTRLGFLVRVFRADVWLSRRGVELGQFSPVGCFVYRRTRIQNGLQPLRWRPAIG